MLAAFRNSCTRFTSTSASSVPKMATPQAVAGRSFKLALIQLGGIGPDKAKNLQRAKELTLRAAKGKNSDGQVDLLVLPEVFNSLYGTEHFEEYAEAISGSSGQGGPSTRMLHELAKETGKWLIGGSIPERDDAGRIYNTWCGSNQCPVRIPLMPIF